MEHIIQFGVSIDDDAIKKQIVKSAEKQIVNELKKDIIRELTGSENEDRYEYRKELTFTIENHIDDFLMKYKKEIIEKATDKLVEKMSRTKQVKEATAQIVAEILK